MIDSLAALIFHFARDAGEAGRGVTVDWHIKEVNINALLHTDSRRNSPLLHGSKPADTKYAMNYL